MDYLPGEGAVKVWKSNKVAEEYKTETGYRRIRLAGYN